MDELHVSNLGVIEDLTINLGPGMTVLSGETGAGKTLIVEALGLILGGRGDTGLIRSGANVARVEARFISDESELVVGRQISSGEPSRAYINGSISRISEISETVSEILHIYGQSEAQSLLSNAIQGAILDRFCGIDYSRYNSLVLERQNLQKRLDLLGGDERSRQRELDLCNLEFEELTKADLTDSGEDQRLKDEINFLSNALEYQSRISEARTLLLERTDGESAMDLLGRARNALSAIPGTDLVAKLDEIIIALREVVRDVVFDGETLDSNPARIEELHYRLQLINRLKKRYGETLGEVIAYRDNLAKRIDELSDDEINAQRIEEDIAKFDELISAEESRILGDRNDGSEHFAKAVQSRLKALAMPNAIFGVELSDTPLGDPVSFVFSSNPGEKLNPVAKAASGGELSRIMLAIRLSTDLVVPSMIFDEIDSGVGGQSALSIGKSLAELAKRVQVIVVTHLAQVAAFAQSQIVISKRVVDGRTLTSADLVEGDSRVAELARMLSGHEHSEKAKAHARELLGRMAGE